MYPPSARPRVYTIGDTSVAARVAPTAVHAAMMRVLRDQIAVTQRARFEDRMDRSIAHGCEGKLEL